MDHEDEKAAGAGIPKSGKDLLGPNTEIGRKLRQFYDEISSEAVPDRFTALLSELERAESAQKKS